MSTDSTTDRRPGRRINGGVIVIGLIFGVVYLVLGIANGSLTSGLVGLGIMIVFTAALVIGSRFSETIALLGDDVHEERNVHIHQRAALYTLNIAAVVIVIGMVVDFARGGDGSPFGWLAAVIAVVYFGSVLTINRRS